MVELSQRPEVQAAISRETEGVYARFDYAGALARGENIEESLQRAQNEVSRGVILDYRTQYREGKDKLSPAQREARAARDQRRREGTPQVSREQLAAQRQLAGTAGPRGISAGPTRISGDPGRGIQTITTPRTVRRVEDTRIAQFRGIPIEQIRQLPPSTVPLQTQYRPPSAPVTKIIEQRPRYLQAIPQFGPSQPLKPKIEPLPGTSGFYEERGITVVPGAFVTSVKYEKLSSGVEVPIAKQELERGILEKSLVFGAGLTSGIPIVGSMFERGRKSFEITRQYDPFVGSKIKKVTIPAAGVTRSGQEFIDKALGVIPVSVRKKAKYLESTPAIVALTGVKSVRKGLGFTEERFKIAGKQPATQALEFGGTGAIYGLGEKVVLRGIASKEAYRIFAGSPAGQLAGKIVRGVEFGAVAGYTAYETYKTKKETGLSTEKALARTTQGYGSFIVGAAGVKGAARFGSMFTGRPIAEEIIAVETVGQKNVREGLLSQERMEAARSALRLELGRVGKPDLPLRVEEPADLFPKRVSYETRKELAGGVGRERRTFFGTEVLKRRGVKIERLSDIDQALGIPFARPGKAAARDVLRAQAYGDRDAVFLASGEKSITFRGELLADIKGYTTFRGRAFRQTTERVPGAGRAVRPSETSFQKIFTSVEDKPGRGAKDILDVVEIQRARKKQLGFSEKELKELSILEKKTAKFRKEDTGYSQYFTGAEARAQRARVSRRGVTKRQDVSGLIRIKPKRSLFVVGQPQALSKITPVSKVPSLPSGFVPSSKIPPSDVPPSIPPPTEIKYIFGGSSISRLTRISQISRPSIISSYYRGGSYWTPPSIIPKGIPFGLLPPGRRARKGRGGRGRQRKARSPTIGGLTLEALGAGRGAFPTLRVPGFGIRGSVLGTRRKRR